ncbi:hypothetical protein ACVWWO_005277 [Bradyrhizobium sp. F1.13.1]
MNTSPYDQDLGRVVRLVALNGKAPDRMGETLIEFLLHDAPLQHHCRKLSDPAAAESGSASFAGRIRT